MRYSPLSAPLSCTGGNVSGHGTRTSSNALSSLAPARGLAIERLKSRAVWPVAGGSPGSAT
ncbi:hypothetical protein, partial [Pseudomonas edaphica]|uniref:hypothetical protein n=1 Tax=Pseudomonas edaphica TaxID=2006980 RepID=UPI001C4B7A12